MKLKKKIMIDELDKIKKIVEDVFGIEDIAVKKRTRKLVNARASFFFHARQRTYYPLNVIGGYLNKDHATVLHGINIYPVCKKWDGYEALHEKVNSEIENTILKRKHDPIEWRDRYIHRLKKLIKASKHETTTH